MWNSVFMNSGTRSNKIGVMGSLSVSPPSTLSRKTRGSPGRVKQGGSKKSFGTNNWHSLGKGEKSCNERKIRKRFSGCWVVEKGEHFWQKVLQKCTGTKRQKKGGLERFSKVECQIFLSKEIVLGHPCIPCVRADTGSDKLPGMRKKGRSRREGGGGEGAWTYTRHKGLKQNFL